MNPARACQLVSLLLVVVAVRCVWSAPVVPEDISDVDDFESKVPVPEELLPSSTSRSVEVPVVRRSVDSIPEDEIVSSRQHHQYIVRRTVGKICIFFCESLSCLYYPTIYACYTFTIPSDCCPSSRIL